MEELTAWNDISVLGPGMGGPELWNIICRNIGIIFWTDPKTEKLWEQEVNIYQKDGWIIYNWSHGKVKNYIFISPKYVWSNQEVIWSRGKNPKKTTMKIGNKNRFITRCVQWEIGYNTFWK